ncbi:glycosyltransferase family 2 protein [Aestuariivirga litoralis]|uniref:glycosyltransferase family 2 protein n=1 Tax=Aestuariivirga litoralis TaxID=2650924 RepID=UPI0018C509E5|nr:glycosyltransferase family A protein [Aestuariivirga litoralis]
MGKLPKFSAVITCHNYESFIAQAIDSVAGQTYKNFECVIVDDCSTDNSAAVIERKLKQLKDPRFTLIKLPHNAGQTMASWQGLQHATGTFLAFLDADDWWMPEFMAQHVAAHLNTHVNVGLTCSDTKLVNGANEILAETWNSFARSRGMKRDALVENGASLPPAMRANEAAPDLTFHEQGYPARWEFAPCSSLVYRRDLLSMIFPRQNAAGMMSIDAVLAILASSLTGWIAISTPLSAYRMHGDNLFSRNLFGGGRQWISGPWSQADKKRVSRNIVDALSENFDRLSPVYGKGHLAKVLLKVGNHSRFLSLKAILKLALKTA